MENNKPIVKTLGSFSKRINKKKKLCMNCKNFIGLNKSGEKYLCWRLKMYSDESGLSLSCEFCEDVNKDHDCQSYKVKLSKIISAYFA